jgi:anti-sigma B factor antagonist
MSGPDIVCLEISFSRLDAAAAPELRNQLEGGPHIGHSRVMLDLSRVEFIDSTGLGVLVAVLKQMAPGGRIAVVGAGPAPARLFQITKLDTLFMLCADSEEARGVLGG